MIRLSYNTSMPGIAYVYPVGYMITNLDGSIVLPTDSTFSETRGIWGQNNVFHRKTDGDIYLNPFMSAFDHFKSGDKYAMPTYDSSGSNWQMLYMSRLPYAPFSNFHHSYSGWESVLYEDSDGRQRLESVMLVIHGRVSFTIYEVKDVESYVQYGVEMIRHNTVMTTYTREGFNVTKDNIETFDPGTLKAFARGGTMSVSTRRQESTVRYPLKDKNLWKPQLNLSEAKDGISAILSNLIENTKVSQENRPDFGMLAAKAAKGRFAINENFLESAIGLLSMKSLVKTLTSRLRRVADLPKDAANKFLALSYGVLPMESDFKAIIDALEKVPHEDKNSFRVETARGAFYDGDITMERRVHLALRGPGAAWTNPFRNLGLAPTPQNLWNLVPYSFVIDWFVDISGFLEDLQTHSDFLSLPLAYAITSEKLTHAYKVSTPGMYGTITHSSYRRDVSERPPQPNYIGSSMQDPSYQNHWLEGTALIVQSKLK